MKPKIQAYRPGQYELPHYKITYPDGLTEIIHVFVDHRGLDPLHEAAEYAVRQWPLRQARLARQETRRAKLRGKRVARRQSGNPRAMQALALRREGLVYREVGERLGGVCVERARQLVKRGERIEKAQIERTRRDKLCAEPPNLGRPIDMGGPRGEWIEFTPEMQFREFSQVR